MDNSKMPKTHGRHPRKLSESEWEIMRLYDREHFEMAIEERFVSRGKGGRPAKNSGMIEAIKEKVRYENTIR